MSARKLQSKLFGAVKDAKEAAKDAVTPAAKKEVPVEDAPGSGAATPVPPSSASAPAAAPAHEGPLKINIPAPISAAPSAAQVQNLPKNPRAPAAHDESTPPVAAEKTPPAPENGASPKPARPASAASDGTPGAAPKTFRDRLRAQLGTRYRSVEEYRLQQSDSYEKHWKRWGPYLSERQWGTVREDYSENGDAWNSFPFSMSKSRAYRWGEDGIAGISDNHQRLCLSLALWNGKDDILKERMYGLTGEQGNHGEDVKELYYYLDSSPTHSYMKYLYKYPQGKYPYQQLLDENRNRSRDVPEFEIMDTGLFDEDRYWDVFVEFAKDEEDENSMSIRITAYNRGPDKADLHLLPQIFFRNTWSWPKELPENMPNLKQIAEGVIETSHESLAPTRLYCLPSPAPAAPTKSGGVVLVDGESIVPDLLFTENETNFERLYGGHNRTPYNKDAFHDYVIPWHRPPMPQPEKPTEDEKTPTGLQDPTLDNKLAATTLEDKAAGDKPAEAKVESATVNGEPVEPEYWPADKFVNPERTGTKAAAHYVFSDVPGNGGCVVVRLKMTPNAPSEDPTILDEELFDDNIEGRRQDADEFYFNLAPSGITDDMRNVMRQALAGMMWTKQYYQYIQQEWLNGDPSQPPPPRSRRFGRNKDWKHLYINDILSMPDKWEYPWFATWDTAFHCIPLAMVDPAFAKRQLDLMTREWYMKPDGALPAYEWNFSDVNPPVHAWATLRVFKQERKIYGREDLNFLERVFQKLLLNFTWWVNRKDAEGNNVFEGGFLGLDNIGAFNRSEPLPSGAKLRQADGTAWMAFFALQMLSIALELSKHNSVYEDIASKFFEHFIHIADAMTYPASNDQELSLWSEEDGFYYDAIQWGYGNATQMPIRSIVGIIPLFATLVLEPHVLKKNPGFRKRMQWFVENQPEVSQRNIASMKSRGRGDRVLLALADKDRLVRILEKMLDEDELLSDYGIRSLSKYHKEHPYSITVDGQTNEVPYWPGDSHSGMFGGNSNWRGPIWICISHLAMESLQRFHQYYGSDLAVECPTDSGYYMNLAGAAEEIQHRLIHIFARDDNGERAVNGGNKKLNHDPHFKDYVQFYEFFHGDTGRGLGASHQTGWTGLVAWHIYSVGEWCRLPKTPKTPRSVAKHYFDEAITPSEAGDGSLYSAYTDVSEAFDEPEPDEL
ncbi:hypothetical protein Q8F55_005513 [Vanrija albida]|uniref:Glycosyl hydrolase family 63 C-terminal domain-containing protein n=1 Tax=Vanrija albida TaxID=181172 RepID=A0ABR3Q1U5_9TREE